jgi:DNA-binding transcriptional LysR family regulator
VLHLAAAPSLVKKHRAVRKLDDLKSWPWLSISGTQFWSAREVTLYPRDGGEQTIPISPILVSEGLTSVCEATRTGLGVAVLPDWLIDADLRAKRLVRLLPQWKTKDVPLHVVYAGQRPLPARVSAFIDFAVAYMTKELAPYT